MSVAYRAEIDGSPGDSYVVLLEGLDINESTDGVNTLQCRILSETGLYRPATNDEFRLYRTDQGSPETVRFAGLIIDTEEMGFVGPNDAPIVIRVTVTDYKDYLERRYVTEDRPVETLKARISAFITTYLTVYGITLDPAQATGPTLAARSYSRTKLLDAFADLVTESQGYALGLSYAKVLGMYAPGSVAAPFDVLEGVGTEQGDIRVKRTRTQSFNRIIVRFGPTAVVEVTETWTGDGVTDTFALTYPAATGPILRTVERTDTASPPVVHYEPVGELGDGPNGAYWEIDRTSDPMTMTRVPDQVGSPAAPDNGDTLTFTHLSQFPQTVVAEDATATTNPWEKVIERPDILDAAVALALATGELAKNLAQPTVVSYQTTTPGLTPGMTQHITSARRNLDDDFVVSEVVEQHEEDGESFLYTVTAVDVDQYTGWRQWHRDILNGGSSTSTSNSTPILYGNAQTAASISATPYGAEPASPAVGDVDLYTNAPLVARYDGSGWQPYGPLVRMTTPPTSGWSWLNQGSSAVSATLGGQLITFAVPTTGVCGRIRAVPSHPYTITVYLDGSRLQENWASWGVFWYDSGTGKLVVVDNGPAAFPPGLNHLRIYKLTTVSTGYAAYSEIPLMGAQHWIRIADNSTNRIVSISHNGQTWSQVHSVSRTDHLTANNVGFGGTDDNAAGTAYNLVSHLLSWEVA
ncbi:MAG: hypothetical protein OEW98_00290 [Betaproteobacteria bacterium]|nr:hypothetical protein [Betaproteobacteria bacterium]